MTFTMYCKIQSNWIDFTGQSLTVVLVFGLNKLTKHLCSESQASSGSYSFYRKHFSKERQQKEFSDLRYVVLIVLFFKEWSREKHLCV